MGDRAGSLKSNSEFTKDVTETNNWKKDGFREIEANSWKAAEETLFHIVFI